MYIYIDMDKWYEKIRGTVVGAVDCERLLSMSVATWLKA